MQIKQSPLKTAGVVAVLCGALIALSGCASDKMTHGIPNFAEVEPGIYRGGQPTTAGWRYLQSLGVRYDVKLNTVREGNDDEAKRLGMMVEAFPITFCQLTIGKPKSGKIWNAASRIQTHTYIHCTHGQDRTGLVVGAYRVLALGWSKPEAYAEMSAHGFHPILRGLYWSWQEDVP
jgi:tyrosine-protein phosphatase SIW14